MNVKNLVFFSRDMKEFLRELYMDYFPGDSRDLANISIEPYNGIISLSGFSKILSTTRKTVEESTALGLEKEISETCEKEGKPILYLSHGAQIRAVNLLGDKAIQEANLNRARTGFYNDYVGAVTANEDPIFNGVNIHELVAKEFHTYDIIQLKDPFIGLVVDSNGNIIVAKHKDVPAYMMQLQPSFDASLHSDFNYKFKDIDVEGKLNADRLLLNFLDICVPELYERDDVFHIRHDLAEKLNQATDISEFPDEFSRNRLIEKVEFRPTNTGKAIYATEIINEGEVVVYAEGSKINRPLKYSRQIGKDIHIVGSSSIDHACDPNVVVSPKSNNLVAWKTIKKGEKLTFNYLTTEWDMASQFSCLCEQERCYEVIKGFKHLAGKQRNDLTERLPVADYIHKHLD